MSAPTLAAVAAALRPEGAQSRLGTALRRDRVDAPVRPSIVFRVEFESPALFFVCTPFPIPMATTIDTIRATPVTVPLEAPLLHSNGAHWGRFVRTIIEVETNDGYVGLG